MDIIEMSEDNRSELARLLRDHLEDRKMNTTTFVREFPDGVQARNIYNWLSGAKVPRGAAAQSALEEVLGWKRGAVRDVIAARKGTRFELSELRDWEKLGVEPEPARASDLPIDELLLELTRKVGALQRENELLRARVDGPSVAEIRTGDTRSAFDLAANDTSGARMQEHLER